LAASDLPRIQWGRRKKVISPLRQEETDRRSSADHETSSIRKWFGNTWWKNREKIGRGRPSPAIHPNPRNVQEGSRPKGPALFCLPRKKARRYFIEVTSSTSQERKRADFQVPKAWAGEKGSCRKRSLE